MLFACEVYEINTCELLLQFNYKVKHRRMNLSKTYATIHIHTQNTFQIKRFHVRIFHARFIKLQAGRLCMDVCVCVFVLFFLSIHRSTC